MTNINIQDSPLLKVKTISAKMLSQVQLIPVTSPRSEKLVIAVSTDDKSEEVQLLGWYAESGKHSGTYVYWLIQDRNQLVRVLAPDKFKPAESNIPQLFAV